jgi:hypothetical protein
MHRILTHRRLRYDLLLGVLLLITLYAESCEP